MADLRQPAEGTTVIGPVKPVEPIDPTNCPTCLSGFQPTDPPYAEAIKAEYGTKESA